MQDVIVFISQLVYIYSLGLSLLPDLEELHYYFFHSLLTSVMKHSPSICVLFVHICSAQDQQPHWLQVPFFFERLDCL